MFLSNWQIEKTIEIWFLKQFQEHSIFPSTSHGQIVWASKSIFQNLFQKSETTNDIGTSNGVVWYYPNGSR